MRRLCTFLLALLFSQQLFSQCYTQAYTAYGTTIARRVDGTLWAKGFNFTGTAATGNTAQLPNYIQIGTDNDWSENFSIGYSHALAIKNDGTLWVWGKNTNGSCGLGLTNLSTIVLPSQVGTDTDWAFVAADEKNSAAIKTDGTLWTWGNNQIGQLGIGSAINYNQLTPIQAGTDANWMKVFSNDDTSFAIKTDGTLWSWGSYGPGNGCKLGYVSINFSVDCRTPHQVGTENNWSSVAVGLITVTGLQNNGMLWVWGETGSYLFGNGALNDFSYVPVQIGSDNDWQQVVTSQLNSIALKLNGTRWAWGSNVVPQIGNGSNSAVPTPTQTDIDTDWAFLSIDTETYIGGNGIKQNHSLYIWGYDILINDFHPVPYPEGTTCLLTTTDFTSLSASVLPNPFTNLIDTQYELTLPETVAISLTNLLGQTVYEKSDNGYSGVNRTVIQTDQLPQGVYILNIASSKSTYKCKLIKN